MRQQERKGTATKHEAVYHAVSPCQAASLSLTAYCLRGLKEACSVEDKQTARFFAGKGRLASLQATAEWLGCASGMHLLCRLKDARLVALAACATWRK